MPEPPLATDSDGVPSEAGPSARTRRIVFLASAVLLAAQISPLYYAQGDAPGYMSIARHVAHGYGLMNRDSPVLWYPPGYSLLISPLFFLGDMPFLAISIFHFFLALALMAGVYLWAKRFAPAAALWAGAITVSTAAFSVHFRRPVSELAFMTVSIWAIVCLERALAETKRPQFVALAVAATLLFGMSGLIRSLGVALAPGAGMRLGLAAMKGRTAWSRAIALALPVMLAPVISVAAVTLRDRSYGHELGRDTYLTAIAEQTNPVLAGSIVPWFAVVVNEIGRDFLPGMWKSYANIGVWWDVNTMLYLPFVLLLFLGWLRWLQRCDDVVNWTLPFYFAILTYCRFESGGRYWLPMTPALVMCAWYALERLGRRRQSLFAALWALHVAATLVFWLGRDRPEALALDARWPEARAMAAIIDHDRDRVAVAEELNDLGYLLSFEFDRRVAERPRGGGPVPQGTRWLIVKSGTAAPAGFTSRKRLEGDVLLLHDSASTNYRPRDIVN